MASTVGIDGLISGLDTTSLINNLMAIEAGPQTLLKDKKDDTDSLVAALQSLNTKVASLATAATKGADPASWNALKASSTASSVTATASGSAQVGTLTFRVTAVAASQASLATVPADLAGRPTFAVTSGGKSVTVTAASSSMADIVDAFNSSATGVRATAVKVNATDADGNPTGATTYRLQLTGTDSGTDHSFAVTYTSADGEKTLALDQVRAASNAAITLFPGSGAEETLTSDSNTFSGVLTGVDVTVSAVTKDDDAPVRIDVTRDTSALSSIASGLVNNLNTVLSEIASRTASTSSTAADGGAIVTGGLLSGDSTILMLQQDLLDQASAPVDGVSPSSIGMVINSDGTFTFDADLFSQALAKDPGQVQSIVSTVSSRLAKTATTASDPTVGSLTAAIQTDQDESKDLADRIKDWDDRLTARREALQQTYTNLETQLSQLQSQSNYLTSALASLTPSTTTSN